MSAIDRGLRPAPASRQSTGLRFTAIALGLSLLVHIGLLILMLMDPPWSQIQDEESPVTVELVPSVPAPPPSPPPVAKVEAPKPEPAPVVKPEIKPEPKPEPVPEPAAPKIDLKRPPLVPPPEPKIELKKPSAAALEPKIELKKPPAAPPQPKIELKKPTPVPPPPPPPKINLHPVEVKEKPTLPAPAPVAPEKEVETAEHGRQNLDPTTRSISDLILTRVSGYWTPPPELRGVRANIHLVIDLKPNGMFGPPFAADGPWDPEAALVGLKKLREDDPRYEALMSFYRTLRDIQPLKLPPGMASNQVRHIPVWFLLDDMP